MTDETRRIDPEEEARLLAETIERIKASHSAIIMWVNPDNSGGYEVLGCLEHAALMLEQQSGRVFKAIQSSMAVETDVPAERMKMN